MKREEIITKAAHEYIFSDKMKNGDDHEHFALAFNGFIDGAKWADKTMIDKACEWLSDNLWIYLDDMLKPHDGYEKLESDFRKAMEE